jgi:hypothetical protein
MILTPALLILLILTAFAPSSLNAADLSVGATAWYTAWDYEDDASDSPEYSPSFLYGPVFALSMTERFSLSFVFLYGEFDMDIVSETMPIKRYDSDLALNYRITDYFKLFLGCKYAGFTWGTDGKHQAIGPGAGISAVIPLGGDLYLLGNASGLYLWGEEESGDDFNDPDSKYNEFGINSSLSIAYYIVPASTTISIGRRYQYFKTSYEKITDELTHHFYGITAAATYSFSL